MSWLVVYCDKDGKQTGEKKWDTKEQARKYAVRLENIGWVVIQIKKATK